MSCSAALVLFAFLVTHGSTYATCPESCICNVKGIADCRNSSASGIPSNLPSNTTELDLRDNPIICDCAFYQQWKELKGNNVEVFGNCSSPPHLIGVSLDALTDESFQCNGLQTSRIITPILPASTRDGANPMSSDQRPTVNNPPEPSSSAFLSRSLVRTSSPLPTPQRSIAVSSASAASSSTASSISGSKSSVVALRPREDESVVASLSVSSSLKPGVSIATKAVLGTVAVSTTAAPNASLSVSPSAPSSVASVSRAISNRTESVSPPGPTVPTMLPGPPTIVNFDTKRIVALESIVSINCTAQGNPPPDVRVTADGVEGVSLTSRESEVEITFLAKRSSEIHCVATNKLGRDKRKMKVIVNQTKAKYLILKVKLVEVEFIDSMKNKESKEFRDLAAQITSGVRSVLNLLPGFLGTSVVKLEPGSVKADVLIKSVNVAEDSVEKELRAELDKAKLGNLVVDRYLYSFEKTSACPSEHENVTWNDAIYGSTDVQPCPRQAKGFAKRNCSRSGWYFPDYTQCRTSDLSDLKKQINQSVFQDINKSTFDQDALTVLEDLINMTSPNEDYALMAGDIITCTEILELLVDYIETVTKDTAHSETEAKNVVKVSSNILHLHNEQEFIVAQKMTQTASRFIRVLERYGLQAARTVSLPKDRNLATLIAENVVMGAGVTSAESVTEDIIFPNYKWPELEEVKKVWNVTTFVVVDQKMVKQMNDGGKEIRIAAFLYRTLTRILSFESAYSDVGLGFEVNSAVVSASIDPKPNFKLSEPVIIASSNLQEVDLEGDEPICAFWDFNMNVPHGGWSEEGCNISAYNRLQTTCQCDHMTNFAVLRKSPIPPVDRQILGGIADFIHCIFISCWIIIAFAGVTFFILLIFSPWLKPDRTWVMHMCVCASIIVAFVLILLGLASYNNLVLCNLFSILVHYFFLCAISWILTESVYMISWNSVNGPRKSYWIGYFFLGWGLPGIPIVVTWALNGLVGFESYISCWMSFKHPLIWVFFGPAFAFFLISCIVFVKVWRAATGQPRQRLKGKYWKTRFRVHVRYSIMLMLMFMITWLFGILLLTYYWRALLCVLFIICCIITGFMILLFYVIMDRQVRDAFLHCCCYCRRSRRGNYWIGGDDRWIEKPEEPDKYHPYESENLVPEPVAADPDQDDDIELNGVHEAEDPLLKMEARPVLETTPSLRSSQESFDPLYERVKRSVEVPVEPVPQDEVQETKIDPIYAKVIKPKPLRHPESDSDDDDLTPEEREARGIRGLTREQVIRMAKKSDASKKKLKDYESPTSSRDDLDKGRAVYLLNQKELDEELMHFRTFFAQTKEASPASEDPPTTSTPDGDGSPWTSLERTSRFRKKETTTTVSKKVDGDTTHSYESHSREQSSSTTVTSKSFSPQSQSSVTQSEERTDEKSIETSEVKAIRSPASMASKAETAIDVSSEELDRLAEEEGGSSPSRATAV